MRHKVFRVAVLFLGLSCGIFFADELPAYVPPIGIPDPGFGIDTVLPLRPGTWTSEIAGYYYVNYSAQGCSDSKAYGVPASPRCTIPNPVPAGSYVEVHGVYDHTIGGTTDIVGNGTGERWVANQSGPAWVVGLASDRPVFTSRTILMGKHLYIDGISARWSADDACVVVASFAGEPKTEFIVVRNSIIEGDRKSRTYGVDVGGHDNAATVANVVVYNNQVFNHGDMVVGDQDADCLHAGNYSNHVWFLNNTVHTASGSGGWAGGAYGGGENCHHIYFGYNLIYNTRQSGLSVKYATDVVFSQNHIRDIVDTSWSPSKGIGYQYAPQRLWILFNKIHGARYGIYGGSTNGGGTWYIYAVGNVIYDIHAPGEYAGGSWDEAGIMMQGGTINAIVSNTIVDCDAGINGPATDVSYYIENNIIQNVTKENGTHLFIENSTSKSVLRNSILHQNGGAERIRWGNATYTLAGFQAASGKGQGCMNSDPMLSDPAGKDFRTTVQSPGIDKGLPDSQLTTNVYQIFSSTYGIDIAKDIDGIKRPQANGWDIGAFEYGSSNSRKPMPPHNVRIGF